VRRMLVTGGAGFIGSNFVRYWKHRRPEDEIVILDALTYAGNIKNLEGLTQDAGIRFVRGNILDEKLVSSLLLDCGIDTIVHFAAESHVDRSIDGPDEFIRTNVVGTHSLLKAAKAVWLDHGCGLPHRFHHVSTDEVYGTLGPSDLPFTEATPYAPNSPYSASKAGSDHLVRAYHETYGLEVSTSNCSNNYGPYQFPEKLIPLCIANILDGRTLSVYGDGLQIRDWLYVDDHNRGIELILEGGRVGQTYNIGGNNEQTNIDIVSMICNLMDLLFERQEDLAQRFPHSPGAEGRSARDLITHGRDRAGHDRRYAINARKITDELGFQPKTSFKKGIEQTIDWYLIMESWWRGIMDGSYLEWIKKNYN